MATIYLIGGCNGAGKTTFAKEVLPKEVKCLRFLNADEIARGLAIAHGYTFGLESTLSRLAHVRLLRDAQRKHYTVNLTYLWLPSASVAIRRVRERVRKGGHGVPDRDIRRRFARSLINLARHYLPLADRWSVFDNSSTAPRLLAEGASDGARVIDVKVFDEIMSRRT